MKSITAVLTMTLIAMSAGCVSPGFSSRNYISTQGVIENGRYHAPNNVFTFGVPPLIQPGARIADNVDPEGQGGDVYFQDDMGTWVNIVYLRLPDDRVDTEAERNELFERFISGEKTEILHRETLEGDQLFAVLKVPEGSNLADMGTGRHLDLVEGVLVFYRNGHVFRLSSQDSRAILRPGELTTEDHVQYLKPEMSEIYSKILFP